MSKTATRLKEYKKDAEPILSEDIYVKIKDDNLKENQLESTLFLYGYPTVSILDILKGLYHENMIKLKAKKIAGNDVYKYMCGFLELNDGTIICTISEDPLETTDYWKKFSELKQMLENLGAKVIFDEYEIKDNIKRKIITSNQYRTNPGKDSKKTIPKALVEELIKDKLICPKEGQTDYHEGLRLDGKTILMINSSIYLKLRKTGNSFRPFKKYWKKAVACNNGSTCVESKLFYYMYYIHKGKALYKHKSDIKGFVSYWIGDDFPPNHIITSFCYKKYVEEERKNFDKVIEVAKKTDPNILVLNKERLLRETDSLLRQTGTLLTNAESMLNSSTPSANKAFDKLIKECLERGLSTEGTKEELRKRLQDYNLNHMTEDILSHVLQPLSIPCPGCILNYNSYKTGKIINWEVLECKIPRGGLKYDSIVEPGTIRSQATENITNAENVEMGNIIKDMSPEEKEKLINSIKDMSFIFPEEKFPKLKTRNQTMNTLSMHEYYTQTPQKTFTRTGSNNSYLGKGKKTKRKKQIRKKSKKNKKGKRVSKKNKYF